MKIAILIAATILIISFILLITKVQNRKSVNALLESGNLVGENFVVYTESSDQTVNSVEIAKALSMAINKKHQVKIPPSYFYTIVESKVTDFSAVTTLGRHEVGINSTDSFLMVTFFIEIQSEKSPSSTETVSDAL